MSATTSRSRSSAVEPPTDLSPEERLFFRDRLREARYAALADAEGFQQMCFAIEALGKRLNPKANTLGQCRHVLQSLARQSTLLPDVNEGDRAIKTFDALFVALKDARNDAMHTGAYARHVAADAVTMCLVLEDALMVKTKTEEEVKRLTVGDFMVSAPVVVHPWQTVEHARQLMLLNSFSYLPIWHDEGWSLIADIAIAKYLRPEWPAKARLKQRLDEANKDGLVFTRTKTVERGAAVTSLLDQRDPPGLWLVRDNRYPDGHLVGVLSPFELM